MKTHYSADPSVKDQAGDIWRGLVPEFRWWSTQSSAIVITPACDLANNKCDWVSFVPVVPLREWFVGRSFFRDVVLQLKEAASLLQLMIPVFLESASITGSHSQALNELEGKVLGIRPVKGQQAHIDRCRAAFLVLRAQIGSGSCTVNDVRACFARGGFEKMVRAVTGNSYRGDIHFLPSDGRVHPYSAMEEDSVALFRYVFSRPIELLEAANDTASQDWASAQDGICDFFPSVTMIPGLRPIKVGALTKVVHSDLVARFVSNQVRLGAPDLPDMQHESIRRSLLEQR